LVGIVLEEEAEDVRAPGAEGDIEAVQRTMPE